MPLSALLPDPEMVLALEPEELAGYLLEFLHSPDGKAYMNIHSIANESYGLGGYSPDYFPRLKQACIEAWIWLEREGLIAPKVGAGEGFVFITRRGEKLKGHLDVAAFHKANLLPKHLLHPIIAQKVWSLFIRGEYDTAVFQAFKEVEVAVREAAECDPTDLGVELMRKAFHPDKGPLTDRNNPVKPEREALAHLFAGAIGYAKNPPSHRHVQLGAEEAVELIMLASHLLRIVDSNKCRATRCSRSSLGTNNPASLK